MIEPTRAGRSERVHQSLVRDSAAANRIRCRRQVGAGVCRELSSALQRLRAQRESDMVGRHIVGHSAQVPAPTESLKSLPSGGRQTGRHVPLGDQCRLPATLYANSISVAQKVAIVYLFPVSRWPSLKRAIIRQPAVGSKLFQFASGRSCVACEAASNCAAAQAAAQRRTMASLLPLVPDDARPKG